MSELEVTTLGSARVSVAGKGLEFPTRKSMALVLYLAVEGRAMARESLAALFWPESERTKARGSLRRALARARQSLETGSAPVAIQAEGERLRLAPADRVWVDARELAEQAEHEGRSSDRLTAALARYQGEFLAGFSLPDTPEFETWVSVQRERAHRQAKAIARRLVELHKSAGALEAALSAADRWLEIAPLDERAARAVMRLNLALGDRSAVRTTFEQLSERLRTELGVDPEAQTAALAARLGEPQVSSEALKGETEPSDPTENFEAPFVGRETEFEDLIRTWGQRGHEGVRVVLLSGESGIGKTRLAERFVGWLEAGGAAVLRGRGYESARDLPYQALVQALRSADPPTGSEVEPPLLALDEVWRSELSRVMPELTPTGSRQEIGFEDPRLARRRLYEGFVRALQALAGDRRLVMFFDDLQWMDSASLDVLAFSLAHWQELGTDVLVLMAARSEALQVTWRLTPPLADWLDRLRHNFEVEVLRLGGLSKAEIESLVETLLGSEQDDAAGRREARALGDWLYRETDGHPLFLSESLRALQQSGMLSWSRERGRWKLAGDEERWQTLLPTLGPGVQQLIRARLSKLSESGRRVLLAAAVLGAGADLHRVGVIAGLGEKRALEGHDEAVEAGFLVPKGERYDFSHDRIRNGILELAGPARRGRAHRRAFRLLQDVGASAAELSDHARAAGLTQKAVSLSLAAGDQAMAVFAVREAIEHYERALRLLEGERTTLELPDQARLLRHLGRAYDVEGRYREANDVYRKLLRLAQRERDDGLAVVARSHLATLALHEGFRLETADLHVQRAQRRADQGDDAEAQSETLWNQAQLELWRGDFDASHRSAERARQLAVEVRDQDLEARSLNALAYAHMFRGRWSSGERCAREAAELFAHMGEQAMETDCLSQQTEAMAQLGQVGAAQEVGERALDQARSLDVLWAIMNCASHLCLPYALAGRVERAVELAEQAVNAAQRIGNPIMLGWCLIRQAEIHGLFGDLDGAAAALDRAAVDKNESEGWQVLVELRYGVSCTAALLSGDVERAARCAQRASADEVVRTAYNLGNLPSLLTAFLAAGDPDAARRRLDEFEQAFPPQPDNRRGQALLEVTRGLLALADGAPDEARQRWQGADAGLVDLGLRGELWLCRAVRARGAGALDGDELENDQLRQAREAFLRLEPGIRRAVGGSESGLDDLMSWLEVGRD